VLPNVRDLGAAGSRRSARSATNLDRRPLGVAADVRALLRAAQVA
jgi:hypothetical protein